MEVSLKAEGTTHEELLKWISGNPTSKLRVHLCGKACPAKVEAKDLVHALKVRLKVTSDEGSWAENLRGTVDELAGLRAEGQVVAEQQRRLQEEEKKDKKEKEKESKKKEKKRDRKRRSSTKSSGSPRRSKEKKKKISSQKELSVVFGTTALDPDPRVRKRVLKLLKKRMKKKKQGSSGSSGSSTAGSSLHTSMESSESGEVFEDSHAALPRRRQELWHSPPSKRCRGNC